MYDREERGIKGLELRAAPKGGKMPTIIGYAAVYDSWSEDLGGFREIIRPGAFTKVLKSRSDVRAFRGHDPERVLGRTPDTLKLSEDKRGLRIEITPPDTELGRETVELIRRGDVDGMSFAFRVDGEGASWNEDFSEHVIREVADLVEVSVVSFPAYKATVADVTRSAQRDGQYERTIARLDATIAKAKKVLDKR